MLTGCQQPNLRDEVDFVNRHMVALNVSVPPPSVALNYELVEDVGNVGKRCMVSATVFCFSEHASETRNPYSFSVRHSRWLVCQKKGLNFILFD